MDTRGIPAAFPNVGRLMEVADLPNALVPRRYVDIHLIHTCCSLIGLHSLPSFLQDVLPTDLIVEKREPRFRLLLGRSVLGDQARVAPGCFLLTCTNRFRVES
jgi:hypothetical protein